MGESVRSEEPESELQKTRTSENSKKQQMRSPALKEEVGDRDQGFRRPRRCVCVCGVGGRGRVISPNLCRGKNVAVNGDQTSGGFRSWVESWVKSVNTDALTPPWNTRKTFLLWQRDV